jgi:hypothetical protein
MAKLLCPNKFLILLSTAMILALMVAGCAQQGGLEPPQPTQLGKTVPPVTPPSTPAPNTPGAEPGGAGGGAPVVKPGQGPGKPAQPPPDSPITSELGPTLEPQPEPWLPTPASPDWKPQPGDVTLSRGQVFLDQADLLTMETFPPQYRINLKGSLPTVCHKLRVVISPPDEGKRIQVEVYSLVKPDMICIQVLAPFEVSIPLEGLSTGTYSVWVNGKQAGEVVVP